MTHTRRKILVVDDEQNMRIALFEALRRNGFDVAVAENGRMALELIEKEAPDAVITDIKMPGMDGIELLQRIKAMRPDLPVVIITGFATVDTAVEAMKLGAFDYILKPFSVEVIESAINRIFVAVSPVVAVKNVDSEAVIWSDRPIIGENKKLLALMEKAKAVASSKATVLILGESGTGKEVFARYIHEQSDRRSGPFVALNCAALPEGLLESELFGHEKGAFTGAVSAKKGKFELADQGTLLLDEISEIPLHLQAKLLRVLQEEEVDRLGGRAPVKIDVHVVATTNRDLALAVQEGVFRKDLYFRLNVIPLRLPALRERKEDILLLADFFIDKFSRQYNRPVKGLASATKRLFLEYPWVGNVREMENLIERGVLLSSSTQFEPGDFWDEEELPLLAHAGPEPGDSLAPPEKGLLSPEPVPLSGANPENSGVALSSAEGDMSSLKDVERQMIMQSLEKTANNRTHAAKLLGISVRTLRNKLHEYRNQGFVE